MGIEITHNCSSETRLVTPPDAFMGATIYIGLIFRQYFEFLNILINGWPLIFEDTRLLE